MSDVEKEKYSQIISSSILGNKKYDIAINHDSIFSFFFFLTKIQPCYTVFTFGTKFNHFQFQSNGLTFFEILHIKKKHNFFYNIIF